jgi:hypothetical protein
VAGQPLGVRKASGVGAAAERQEKLKAGNEGKRANEAMDGRDWGPVWICPTAQRLCRPDSATLRMRVICHATGESDWS